MDKLTRVSILWLHIAEVCSVQFGGSGGDWGDLQCDKASVAHLSNPLIDLPLLDFLVPCHFPHFLTSAVFDHFPNQLITKSLS